MNRLIAFIKKEFYHIFRDKRTMLILFGMPLVQILLFGYAITNEIKEAKIAILDKSNDHITEQITNKILASGYFVLDEQLTHDSQLESTFEKGRIKQAIIFEEEFAENLEKYGKAHVQLIGDATDPNTSNTLISYTTAVINDFVLEYNQIEQLPISLVPETRMLFNPNMKSVYLFVPGLITIILMLISAMMTSISIAKEKELGTMEVLLVSPMHPAQVIISKVIPYLLLAFINVLIVLSIGYWIFKVPISGSLMLLLSESVLFILLALSLGILISTITSSQQTALMISLMGLMLPTILLSGFIFPIENMPIVLQWISNIIPARWFIIIIKDIMLKGVGIEFFWKETLILLGFTMLFIVGSVKKFKMRLE